MKVTSLIAGSVLSLFAFAANADLDIINNTTSTISAIYLSDNAVEDWEENVIEGSVVNPGETMHIEVEVKYDKFDLRVESTEGGYEDYYEFPGNATVIQLNGAGKSQYK
jgi:hypothetical protein